MTTNPDLQAAEEALHATFGFSGFRPGQDEVVAAVLSGQNVLAVMPTGSGKSLCYQLPALLRDGLTVVVSPLIALMRNQVAQLQAFGVSAASLSSANDAGENRLILDEIDEGRLRIVYIAPERLVRPETIERLKRARVSLLAVDEAHCISQWGHDFRPEYMALGEVRAALGDVQVIALTATADAATRSDVAGRLFAQPPLTFVHGFDRPNIRLAMRPKASAKQQILQFLKDHRGESGIVYCSSRRQTEEIAAFLRDNEFHALAYHAGMEGDLRSRHQDIFLQRDGIVIAATVAFGMGIDKPDVRFVCHAAMPSSIESYYQEIGRAGRDGLPAEALTLYGLDDIRLRRLQLEEREASDDQKRVERQRLNALVALCEAPRCRRQTLLAYFGETIEPCGNCDLCIDGVDVIDGRVPAQKALSAIARTGERFGSEHLIAILCGDATENVVRFGHDRLPTFGVGKEFGKKEWRAIFRQLYAVGALSMDITQFGSWTITDYGQAIMKGGAAIELRREPLQAAGGKGRSGGGRPTAARAAAQALLQDLSSNDRELYEALKAQRMALAQDQNVPAYVVFPDRTLLEMAQEKPASEDALAGLHGVGRAKLARYGALFLEVIRQHA